MKECVESRCDASRCILKHLMYFTVLLRVTVLYLGFEETTGEDDDGNGGHDGPIVAHKGDCAIGVVGGDSEGAAEKEAEEE